MRRVSGHLQVKWSHRAPLYKTALHRYRVCPFGAVKHCVKYTNIPLGVFKHVFGKDQAVEALVPIILAVPLEKGEERLRKGTRRERVNYGRSRKE